MAIKSDPTTRVDENINIVTRTVHPASKQILLEPETDVVPPTVVKGITTPVVEDQVSASTGISRYDIKQLLENIASWVNKNISSDDRQKLSAFKDKSQAFQLAGQWLDRYSADLTWVKTSMTLDQRQSMVSQYRDWLVASLVARY